MVSFPVRFFFALSRTPLPFPGDCKGGTEYFRVKGKNAKVKSRKEGSMYAEKVFPSLPIIHNNQNFASIPMYDGLVCGQADHLCNRWWGRVSYVTLKK